MNVVFLNYLYATTSPILTEHIQGASVQLSPQSVLPSYVRIDDCLFLTNTEQGVFTIIQDSVSQGILPRNLKLFEDNDQVLEDHTGTIEEGFLREPRTHGRDILLNDDREKLEANAIDKKLRKDLCEARKNYSCVNPAWNNVVSALQQQGISCSLISDSDPESGMRLRPAATTLGLQLSQEYQQPLFAHDAGFVFANGATFEIKDEKPRVLSKDRKICVCPEGIVASVSKSKALTFLFETLGLDPKQEIFAFVDDKAGNCADMKKAFPKSTVICFTQHIEKPAQAELDKLKAGFAPDAGFFKKSVITENDRLQVLLSFLTAYHEMTFEHIKFSENQPAIDLIQDALYEGQTTQALEDLNKARSTINQFLTKKANDVNAFKGAYAHEKAITDAFFIAKLCESTLAGLLPENQKTLIRTFIKQRQRQIIEQMPWDNALDAYNSTGGDNFGKIIYERSSLDPAKDMFARLALELVQHQLHTSLNS